MYLGSLSGTEVGNMTLTFASAVKKTTAVQTVGYPWTDFN